jgi:hypothetical protein
MTAAVGLVAVAVFAVAIRLLGLVRFARSALVKSRAAARVLMDRGKTELEKEQAARDAGVQLFGCSARLVAGICLAAAPAVGLVAAATAAGVTSMDKVAGSLSSPWMLAAACVVSIPAFMTR